MKTQHAVGLFAVAMVGWWSSGCGEPEFVCTAEQTGWSDPKASVSESLCSAAAIHAAHDTSELIPTQTEIDRYYERLLRVNAAEPALTRALFRYDAGLYVRMSLRTNNPLVLSAWMGVRDQPAPPTGVPVFDQVMSEIGAIPYNSQPGASGDYVGFSIRSSRVFNPWVLEERLVPTSSWLPSVGEPIVGDIGATWRWIDAAGTGTDEAQAEIDIVVGWGDCFVGCSFHHAFLAIVPPVGDAVVYDLGGAPLPDGWELSPNTVPPP